MDLIPLRVTLKPSQSALQAGHPSHRVSLLHRLNSSLAEFLLHIMQVLSLLSKLSSILYRMLNKWQAPILRDLLKVPLQVLIARMPSGNWPD